MQQQQPLFGTIGELPIYAFSSLTGVTKTSGLTAKNRAVDLLKDLFSGVANKKS
jgi:hypothetical protein